MGRLSEPLVSEVEEHLLVCAGCREKVDEAEKFSLAMKEAIASEPAEQPRRWLAFKAPVWIAAAGFASVTLVAVLFLLARQNSLPPLATLQLSAMRGDAGSIAVARETDITLADAPQGMNPRVELVDASGSSVWSGSLTDGADIRIRKRLSEGSYFVRLYDNSGKLLHEYAFRVRAGL